MPNLNILQFRNHLLAADALITGLFLLEQQPFPSMFQLLALLY
jgi:hypothetical protein